MQIRRLTLSLSLCLLSLAAAGAQAAPPTPPSWPTLAQQLARETAVPGSALERLIADNQDFHLLRPEEAQERGGVPAWLRVWWRKAHPETTASPGDPTGGYPRVLAEIHDWMRTHQDLLPGIAADPTPPPVAALTVGSDLRISGSPPGPRSESDIRINFWNPQQIVAASNEITGSGLQAQFYSTDGGATWGQTNLPAAGGDVLHSDPAVEWTSDGTAWAATIGMDPTITNLRMRAYKSLTGGATWVFDGTFSGNQTDTDKELLWADHSATSPYKDNVYACWHNGPPVFFNRRTGGAAGTWGATPKQVSGSETGGTGIGCSISTNAAGHVFVFWPDTGSARILVAKSTDGGATFAAPVIAATGFAVYEINVPSFQNRRALIYASGAAYSNGTVDDVYVAWTDLTGAAGCTTNANAPGGNAASSCKSRVWLTRSTDGGHTWAPAAMVNNQASLNDQFNQGLAVDPSTDTLALIYYDTVNDPNRRKTDVFSQTSTDRGATWSTPAKVTTAMTDETIAGTNLGNQYGDYNGLSGYANRFFPSWTDRRGSGHESIWTAAITGPGSGCTPPAAPALVTATAAGTGQVNLVWAAVPGATEYHVLRAATPAGPYVQITTTAGLTFADTGRTCNTAYSYKVRAFAGCESADAGPATATTAACPGPAVTDFYTLPLCRLVDTRLPDGPLGGPVLQGAVERTFALTGACGVPAGAKALVVNVTAVQPAAAGNLQIYPADAARPLTSTLNFAAGEVRANSAILPLSGDGTGRVTVRAGLTGTVHLAVDVSGYFQ